MPRSPSSEMNQRPGPFFSLVAPTFNEAANIETFLTRESAVLDQRIPGNYEIIIVDDNTPDRTGEIAEAAARTRQNVSVVQRNTERGLATAVVAGWRAARGD